MRKAEESLGILNNNSRNAGSKAHKSPTHAVRQGIDTFELGANTQASVHSGNNNNSSQATTALASNQGISRSRVKGLQNSHSNKRLPTWKNTANNSSLLALDKGISSPVFERGGIADRSMDRASANAKGNLLSGGGNIVMMSRAELL